MLGDPVGPSGYNQVMYYLVPIKDRNAWQSINGDGEVRGDFPKGKSEVRGPFSYAGTSRITAKGVPFVGGIRDRCRGPRRGPEKRLRVVGSVFRVFPRLGSVRS